MRVGAVVLWSVVELGDVGLCRGLGMHGELLSSVEMQGIWRLVWGVQCGAEKGS